MAIGQSGQWFFVLDSVLPPEVRALPETAFYDITPALSASIY